MAKAKSLTKTTSSANIQIYCRKCMQTKSSLDFFTAVDPLDSNGYMSICKKCCNELYDIFFVVEGSLEKAILQSCKALNVEYSSRAVTATQQHLSKLDERSENSSVAIFGIYKSKLLTMNSEKGSYAHTFEEYPAANEVITNTPEQEGDQDYITAKDFWGKERPYDEIEYLQREYNALIKGGAPHDTRTATILLQQICLVLLDVKKKRDLNQSVKHELDTLTSLMQSAAMRPDQKKVADGNDSQHAFGVWLAEIEKKRPAEWFEDQNIYKDVSDIKEQWETHIVRPMKNFWGLDRNFKFEGAVETSGDAMDDIGEE